MPRRFRQTYSTGFQNFPGNSTSRGVINVAPPGQSSYREIEFLAAGMIFVLTGGIFNLSIPNVVLYSGVNDGSFGLAGNNELQIQPIISASSTNEEAYQNGRRNLVTPLDTLFLLWAVTNSGAVAQNGIALNVTLQYVEYTIPGGVPHSAGAGYEALDT